MNGVHLQAQKAYALQTGDKVRFGFDNNEYRFINFGLLDAKNKDLDKTAHQETENKFMDDHKLHDLKNPAKAQQSPSRPLSSYSPKGGQLMANTIEQPAGKTYFSSQQGSTSGQNQPSQIEGSLLALVDKLETEIALLNNKIAVQQQELARSELELQGTASKRKDLQTDQEAVKMVYFSTCPKWKLLKSS